MCCNKRELYYYYLFIQAPILCIGHAEWPQPLPATCAPTSAPVHAQPMEGRADPELLPPPPPQTQAYPTGQIRA